MNIRRSALVDFEESRLNRRRTGVRASLAFEGAPVEERSPISPFILSTRPGRARALGVALFVARDGYKTGREVGVGTLGFTSACA